MENKEIVLPPAEVDRRYKSFIKSKYKRGGANWQQVYETRGAPCGEGSPYWDYQNRAAKRDEDGSVLDAERAAPNSPYPKSADMSTEIRNEEIVNDVKERVHKLMSHAKQILTEQQYNVFMLTMVKDPALTYREAAKVLGISFARVGQHFKTVQAKLQRAYDERTEN